MSLLRSFSLLVCLVFAGALASGTASAQGGRKSLAELKAQAKTIKIGRAEGATEAEVIAIMGPPAKSKEDTKIFGGGMEIRERKLLSYGPNDDIVIVIMKDTGKVMNIKYGE